MGRPYAAISFITSHGITSNLMSKKSSPRSWATCRISRKRGEIKGDRLLKLLFGQKGSQSVVDLLAGVDADEDEVFPLPAGEFFVKGAGLRPQLPGRGAVKAPPAAVADLPVSHHPADFQELLHQLAAAGIVVAEVFAVRKVEGVQVPFAGRVVLPDVAQRQVVSGGAPGAPAAGDREKVVFGDHVRVDVVRDKHQVA